MSGDAEYQEALREVDALCPGSEPLLDERPAAVPRRDLVLTEAVSWLAFVGLSIAAGCGFAWLNAHHPARGAVKASGLALPAISYPSAGAILQSSGGVLSWVNAGPATEVTSLPVELAPARRRRAPTATKFFSSWDECFHAGGVSIGASMFGDCNLYCSDRRYKRLGRIGSPFDPPGECATITSGVATDADLARTSEWMCRFSPAYRKSHPCDSIKYTPGTGNYAD